MDLSVVGVMFHAVAQAIAGGAAAVTLFLVAVGYLRYAGGKDRSRCRVL